MFAYRRHASRTQKYGLFRVSLIFKDKSDAHECLKSRRGRREKFAGVRKKIET